MKVVLNKSFGGFGLSKEAYEYMGEKWDGYGVRFDNKEFRTDERLVKCVEEIGNRASAYGDDLEVVEIPDNSFWIIDEYDGIETIYYSESEIYVK